MKFGQKKPEFNVNSLGRKVSDIKEDELKTSILLLGQSAAGKSVSVTGGKFKKLDVNGNIINVDVPSFPLPMLVIDIDHGSLQNIKTLDNEIQEQFLYFDVTKVNEVSDILEAVYEHHKILSEKIADNNDESNEDSKDSENNESIFGDEMYKTIFIDGIHHVWFDLKSNMAIIKAKQNNVNLVKAMSSGVLTSIDKVTPSGTEYLPASTVWIKFSELLRKNKKYSNIVCTAGIEKNEWGKTVTTKFLGHKNQEASYDIWGMSECEEKYVQDKGIHKKYFFTASRVRGNISGVKIEDFSYSKLQEVLQ